MSKTVSANLLAEIQSGAPNVSTCWKIEREDGTVLGFTDWPVEFDYSSVTYTPAGGYERTAIDQKDGLNVDNMEIFGLIDSAHITEDDLLSNKYLNAKVWIFLVSPNNLGWGEMKLDYGTIGEISIRDGLYVAEFRSLTYKLAQKFGNKFSRYCRWILGDSNCGVILEPDVWAASTAYVVGDYVRASVYDERRYICTTAGTSNDVEGEPTWDTTIGNTTTETDGVEWEALAAFTFEGEVDSVTSNYIFGDSSFSESDDWFQYGILTWVTGNNAGTSYDVKASTNTGSFTLKQEAVKDVQVGDDFKVSVGCNHILKMPSDTVGTAYTGDCRAKFDNVMNYGGEPELPNLDRVTTPADKA